MTWQDVRIATLQKMFEIQGDTLEENDATRPYILSMPQVANEGLLRLATVGRYLLRELTLVHGAVPTGEIPTVTSALGPGWRRYDMTGLDADFYDFDEMEIFFQAGATVGRTSDFRIEAERILMLPGERAGLWRVHYRVYPGEISRETLPGYVLPLHPEMAVILPLYMASQLYKDDDAGMSTTWRNEFEVALEALIAKNRRKRMGREEIENTTGWW